MSALSKPAAGRDVIGEVRFDLSLPVEGSGVKDATDLAWHLRLDVLPGIEAALDEFSAAGADVHIEELEIDLGQLTMPLDWSAMRRGVQTRLLAALTARAGVSTNVADKLPAASAAGTAPRGTVRDLPGNGSTGAKFAAPPDARPRRAAALGTWREGLPKSGARLAWLARMKDREPRSLIALLRALSEDGERLRRLVDPMTGTQRIRFSELLGRNAGDRKRMPSTDDIARALRDYLVGSDNDGKAIDAAARTQMSTPDVPGLMARLKAASHPEQIGLLATLPAAQRGVLLTALVASGHDTVIVQQLAMLILRGAASNEGVTVDRRGGAAMPAADNGERTDSSKPAATEAILIPELTGAALLRAWREDPVAFAADVARLPVDALPRLLRVVARVAGQDLALAVETQEPSAFRDELTAIILGRDFSGLPTVSEETVLPEPAPTGQSRRDRSTSVDPDAEMKPETLPRVDTMGTGAAGDDDLPVWETPTPPERPCHSLTYHAALRMLYEWQANPETLAAFVAAQDAEELLALLTRLRLLFDIPESVPRAGAEDTTPTSAAGPARDILDELAFLSEAVTTKPELIDPADIERLLAEWHADPTALGSFLERQTPEGLHRLIHLVRPWTGAETGYRAPPLEATRRAALHAVIAEAVRHEGNSAGLTKDAMLRRAMAWQADPALIPRFLQLASGAEIARWIEALSDWVGLGAPAEAETGPAPASLVDVLAGLAARAVSIGQATAIAAMEVPDAGLDLTFDISAEQERAAVLRIVPDLIAGGLSEEQGRALGQELEPAQTAGSVWARAMGWLSSHQAQPGAADRRFAGLGRLLATWRRDPSSLKRFIDLRGTAELARLIRPQINLPMEADAGAHGVIATIDEFLRAFRRSETVRSKGRDGLSDTGETAEGFWADRNPDAEPESAGPDGVPPVAASGSVAGPIDTPPDRRGPPDAAARASGEAEPEVGASSPTVPEFPKAADQELPLRTGRDPAKPTHPSASAPEAATEHGAPLGHGEDEPAASLVPVEIERRADMLAIWRLDPPGFFAKVTEYSADDLLSLLAGVLSTGQAANLPPLWQAVTREAGQSRDARAFLELVLQRIALKQPVDPKALAQATEPAATSAGELEAPAIAPLGGGEREVLGPVLLPIADLLDTVGEVEDAWVAEVLAAALLETGGLAAALGSARLGLLRTARLVERMAAEDLECLADALPRGMAERDRELVRLLWQALPHDMMAPGLSRITRWQFILLFSDGAFPRSGGVSGLVGTALDWLAGRSATRGQMVRALHDSLTARRRDRAAGAVAQLISALGQEAGAESAQISGTDPEKDASPAAEMTAFTQSAGLVLLAPYLPRLFQRFDLISGGAFKNEDRLHKAFDLLHCILFDRTQPSHAPRPLEKLLCGVPRDVKLGPPLPVENDEREVIEDMLGAVIQRWSALGGTSVDGLREAFLRREGLLETRDGVIRLKVAPMPYDMLLDRLPWSLGVVKFAWMEDALYVDWRNTHG